MNPDLKRLPARFYRLDSGREPVREWLQKLALEDRKIIGEDIKDVEFSWPIGMPLVLGKLQSGIWTWRRDARKEVDHEKEERRIILR